MIRFIVYCICVWFERKQMKDFRILYCGKENKIDKYKNKGKNTEKFLISYLNKKKGEIKCILCYL